MKLEITFFIMIFSLIAFGPANAGCTINVNSEIEPVKPDSIYTDNGDGTVTDDETGLMWQKCTLGLSGSDCSTGSVQLVTWQAALAMARDNTDLGYSDWRLPSKNEMASILEQVCWSPAINQTVFPNTPGTGRFWTSSPRASVHEISWVVLSRDGFLSWDPKDSVNEVRLVRGGL